MKDNENENKVQSSASQEEIDSGMTAEAKESLLDDTSDNDRDDQLDAKANGIAEQDNEQTDESTLKEKVDQPGRGNEDESVESLDVNSVASPDSEDYFSNYIKEEQDASLKVENEVADDGTDPEDVDDDDAFGLPPVLHPMDDSYHCDDEASANEILFGFLSETTADEGSYMCNFCPSTHNSQHSFIGHALSHIFNCELCEFWALTRGELVRHQLMQHATQHQDTYKLQAMFMSGQKLSKLKRNIERKIIGRRNPLAVEDNSNSSVESSHTEVLFSVPTLIDEQGAFQCLKCDFRVTAFSSFDEHYRTHTGLKVWACLYCDYTTNKRTDGASHVKKWHKGKPYQLRRCTPFTKDEDIVFVYECDYCQVTNKHKTWITEHLDEAHPGCERKLCVQVCRQMTTLSKAHSDIVDLDAPIFSPAKPNTKPSSKSSITCSADDSDSQTNFPYDLTDEHKTERYTTSSGEVTIVTILDTTPRKSEAELFARSNGQAACLTCKYVSRGERALELIREHVTTHTNDRIWGCAYCSFRHNRRLNIINHVTREHPSKNLTIIRRRDQAFTNHSSMRATDSPPAKRHKGSGDESPAESISGNHYFKYVDNGTTETVPVIKMSNTPKDLKQDLTTLYSVVVRDNCRVARCKHCPHESKGPRCVSYIREHVTVHVGGRQWGCPYCSMQKVRPAPMIHHVKLAHPTQKLCIIKRRANGNLKAPTNKKLIEKSEEQNDEKKNASLSDDYEADKLVECENGWECKLCGKIDTVESVMKRHMRRGHGITVVRNKYNSYQCSHCVLHYRDIEKARTHLNAKHSKLKSTVEAFKESSKNPQKLLLCRDCRYFSISENNLNAHIHSYHSPGKSSRRLSIKSASSSSKGLSPMANDLNDDKTTARAFQCGKCDFRGDSVTAVGDHCQKSHKSDPFRVIIDCWARSLRKQSISYMCSSQGCGFTATTKANMMSHAIPCKQAMKK